MLGACHAAGSLVEVVVGPAMLGALLDPQGLVEVAFVGPAMLGALLDPHRAAGCLVAEVVVGPAMLLLVEVVGTLGPAMLGALLSQLLVEVAFVSPPAMLGARSLGNLAQLVQGAPKASPQQTLIYLGRMQVQCIPPPSCFYI